jgi:glycogen operon protein
MLATVLLSQGTPMILAGDEFARTQHGNNNAYCQDSEITWVNWQLDADASSLLAFTKTLVGLRKTYPALRRSRFLTGQVDEALGVRDLTWINANGSEMLPVHWEDGNTKCLGMLIDGRARKTGIGRRGEDASVFIVLNSFEGVVDFTLPKDGGEDSNWLLLVDTNLTVPESNAKFRSGDIYQVTGRSLLLFARSD